MIIKAAGIICLELPFPLNAQKAFTLSTCIERVLFSICSSLFLFCNNLMEWLVNEFSLILFLYYFFSCFRISKEQDYMSSTICYLE